ncbi:MAG TPA: diacylglycerol kinase family protein [Sphingomicrobium sp.]|nr:diacylglycerol kinase family protein [Sphingomicrobium sp.]
MKTASDENRSDMAMRFLAVLNKDGGTLRTTDLNALSGRMKAALEGNGHTLEIRIVSGKEVTEALRDAATAREADVLLAGGGDGTISAAAGCVMESGTALGVLPAGTMNLFARSLRIPLGLDQAIEAFATGRVRAVDMGSANGRPFVHQFSVGMHARLVELRSRMAFSSKFGKMRASLKAMVDTIRSPSALRVTLLMDDAEIVATTAGISVSNNLYGEGHLPFADDPDAGVLGIYVSNARRRRDLLRLCLNIGIGRWKENEHVEIHQSDAVTLRVEATRRARSAVIDGELCPLAPETTLRIHPGSLKVLVPADSGS